MPSQRDFEFGKELGRGSFGVVYMVHRKSDGCPCVCKQIQLKNMSGRAREEANKEVALLRKVSHGSDYIVQYMGSFLEEEALHIVMEFCQKGDLGQFLKARESRLEERAVWRFLLQIGLGLRWLHLNRILHRDIKTLNVFLKTNNDVRLGDLGVARVLSQNTNFAHTFIGTPYYLSPELCEEKPYNELSDVWAFGCVIYEMCTLRHPFEAKNQAALLIKILRGQFAPIDASYSDDLRNLIDGCMRREWTKRTKLADMLVQPVVRSWAETLGISLEQRGVDSSPTSGAASSATRRGPPRMPLEKRTSPRPSGSGGTPATRAGSAGSAGSAGGKPGSAPKAMIRRSSEQQPTPGRVVRVRADPRSGSGARRAEEGVAGRSVTLVAPPASSGALVAKVPPGKTSALRPAPSAPSAGYEHEAKPTKRKSPTHADSQEARRKAAQEVADLPDIVVSSTRPSRNVPSVQQLLSMDSDSPIKKMLQRNGGRLTQAATSMAATLTPEEALRQASEELEDEATIRPPAANEEVSEEIDYQSHESDAPDSVPEDEEFSDAEGGPSAPHLRLLQPRRSGSELGEEVAGDMLTYCSAFDGEDSLGYTMGDTESSLASALGSTRGDAPGLEVEMRWGVEDPAGTATSFTGEPQLTAKLDSDGLLCDARAWGGPASSLGACEDKTSPVEPSMASVESAAAVAGATAPGEVSEEEEEPRQPPEPSPAPALPARPPPDPRVQVARLTTQISRLYSDVVKDLDAPARAVWDELYGLFQAKMAVDLTDEDQSEIERYVFEHLPTESTDMIWKVYKVLHLEQERDRWQRLLDS